MNVIMVLIIDLMEKIFIITGLAEECERQFTCLGENTENK